MQGKCFRMEVAQLYLNSKSNVIVGLRLGAMAEFREERHWLYFNMANSYRGEVAS